MTVTRQDTSTQDPGERSSSSQTLRRSTQNEPKMIEIAETSNEESQPMKDLGEAEDDFEIDVNMKKAKKDDPDPPQSDQGAVEELNPPQDMSNAREKLQRRLNAINARREQRLLECRLQKAKTNKAAEFSDVAQISLKAINKAVKQKEKLFAIIPFKKYKELNQKDLNVFVREVVAVFEIRPVTYALDRDKINLAQGLLEETSANDWFDRKKVEIDDIITWTKFVNYLQKLLNPTHLRALDVSHKMKNCRQRLGQTVAKLISYINTLETQLSIQLFDYVRYFNLLKALHSYFRNVVIRRISGVMSRIEFEELVRLAEKSEWMPDNIRAKIQKRKRENEDDHEKRFRVHQHSYRSGDDQAQEAINEVFPQRAVSDDRGRGRNDDRDGSNRESRDRGNARGFGRSGREGFGQEKSQMMCYYCQKQRHWQNECRKKAADVEARKAQKSSTSSPS